jgi:hypothetical protein
MDDETIVFADVNNCLEMCRTIFKDMTEVYSHSAPVTQSYTTYGGYNNKYTPPNPTASRYGTYYDWDDWDTKPTINKDDKDKDDKDIEYYSSHEQCESCMEWGEVEHMDFSYDYNCYLCPNCSSELVYDNYQQPKK